LTLDGDGEKAINEARGSIDDTNEEDVDTALAEDELQNIENDSMGLFSEEVILETSDPSTIVDTPTPSLENEPKRYFIVRSTGFDHISKCRDKGTWICKSLKSKEIILKALEKSEVFLLISMINSSCFQGYASIFEKKPPKDQEEVTFGYLEIAPDDILLSLNT